MTSVSTSSAAPSSFSTFRAMSFADLAPSPGSEPDYEAIRAAADRMVPFNTFVGVRITHVARDGALVESPVNPDMHNQMGTVHAGVLFLLGEVACAGAFCGALAPVLAEAERFVLRDARIQYLKPALGRIHARGTVDDRVCAGVRDGSIRGRFDLDGKAELFDDNEVKVARMWFDYVCSVGSPS